MNKQSEYPKRIIEVFVDGNKMVSFEVDGIFSEIKIKTRKMKKPMEKSAAESAAYSAYSAYLADSAARPAAFLKCKATLLRLLKENIEES